ncbi:hypothetical protein EDB86DRAFT_2828712 [Lactarius hatsudake]|nr:hypothetical protein EDB86DRAFT_2828712 [Lactarius hatsudake]
MATVLEEMKVLVIRQRGQSVLTREDGRGVDRDSLVHNCLPRFPVFNDDTAATLELEITNLKFAAFVQSLLQSNDTASSMAIYLPFDILTAIFEEVEDVHDLLHIRIVSHTFCAAATPIAFRVLSVIATTESAQNLRQLFDVPDIANHVREIAFRDSDTDGTGRILKYVKGGTVDELANSFSRVYQLPRLETINLTFYPRYGNRLDSDGGRPALQSSILSALVSSFSVCTPNLTSLFLHNLRTSDLSSLESPSFQTILTTLRRFQLSPLFDPPNSVTVDDSWSYFWGNICPRMLTPMQYSLTELTLHSNVHVGALAGLSFDGLHFPRLCAVSLGRVVFDTSVGVQDFILRHAATLARLELLMCKLPITLTPSIFSSIAVTVNDPSSDADNWARVWDCFEAKLTALVSLRVDESHDGYYFQYGSNLGPYAFTTPRAATNAVALRRLHMTVVARSEKFNPQMVLTSHVTTANALAGASKGASACMNINLPFEILTAIFEGVEDVRVIWHIRAASRTFCAAATPFAFRILSVITTTGSTQNLGQFFDAPDIAAHWTRNSRLAPGLSS